MSLWAAAPTTPWPIPMLFDSENTDDYVWADSAYADEYVEDLLNLWGFESSILAKGSSKYRPSDAAKERNSVKSANRACVKNIFDCMTMAIVGGKMTRKFGIERRK